MSFTDLVTDVRDMVIQLQRSKNKTSELLSSGLALNSRMIQGMAVDLEQLETMDVVLLIILAVGCLSTVTITLTTYFLMKRLREQGSRAERNYYKSASQLLRTSKTTRDFGINVESSAIQHSEKPENEPRNFDSNNNNC